MTKKKIGYYMIRLRGGEYPSRAIYKTLGEAIIDAQDLVRDMKRSATVQQAIVTIRPVRDRRGRITDQIELVERTEPEKTRLDRRIAV